MAEESFNNIDSQKNNWDDVFRDRDFITHLDRFLNKREHWTLQEVFFKIVLLLGYSAIIIRITLSFVEP